jgi:transposase
MGTEGAMELARAGADRLIASVVQVFGAAQAHHAYLFANARHADEAGGARWLWRVVRNAPPEPATLCLAQRWGAAAATALTQAQFDALIVGLPRQRLAHMQTITRV